MEYKKISEGLNEYWRALETKYEILPIFMSLVGSQNYGLDNESSDIDVKCWTLPYFNEWVLMERPLNRTILMDKGTIEVKDIRLYFNEFWKQNINFLEVLFSPYVMMNKKFVSYYEELVKLRERIACYDNFKYLNCLCGTAKQKFDLIIKDDEEQSARRSKNLSHLFRMDEMICHFMVGDSFKESLINYNIYGRDFLVKMKKKIYTLPEAKKMAEEVMEKIDAVRAEYLNNHEHKIDIEVRNKVEEILFNILKENIRKELKGYD